MSKFLLPILFLLSVNSFAFDATTIKQACDEARGTDRPSPNIICALGLTANILPPLFTAFGITYSTQNYHLKADAIRVMIENYEMEGSIGPELQSVINEFKLRSHEQNIELTDDRVLMILESVII
jgi:hypothetical protein